MGITYAERADLQPEELQDLFASAWAGAEKPGYDEVLARSFSWISAHDEDRLVGFVDIAWDGGVHFFMLDTTVHPEVPAPRHRQHPRSQGHRGVSRAWRVAARGLR